MLYHGVVLLQLIEKLTRRIWVRLTSIAIGQAQQHR